MLGLPEALKAGGCHLPAKPWHSLRHLSPDHLAAEIQRMSFAPAVPADVTDINAARGSV